MYSVSGYGSNENKRPRFDSLAVRQVGKKASRLARYPRGSRCWDDLPGVGRCVGSAFRVRSVRLIFLCQARLKSGWCDDRNGAVPPTISPHEYSLGNFWINEDQCIYITSALLPLGDR